MFTIHYYLAYRPTACAVKNARIVLHHRSCGIFWGIANGSCWVEDAGEADEDVDFSKHLRDVTDCLAHYICIRNI